MIPDTHLKYFISYILIITLWMTGIESAWCDNYRLKAVFPATEKQWFFDHPAGVCIDEHDYVYVVDQDNHCIKKFNSDGRFVLSFGAKGAEPGFFNSPTGITCYDQCIFVVDTNNHRIAKFSTNGELMRHWGEYGTMPGAFKYPMDIAIDHFGDVYITDSGNYRIQKFHANGTFIDTWGHRGDGDGEFEYPAGIAIDQNNSIYVVDPDLLRMQIFSFNGDWLTTYERWGSYSRPNMISIDTQNQIYISTSGNFIEHYNENHVFQGYIGRSGDEPGEFFMPWEVATSSNGSLYVSDSLNHRVQVFMNNDMEIIQWTNSGSRAGMFNCPKGMAVGNNDSLYVVDSNNHRIQQVTTDGQFLAQWGEEGSASDQFLYPTDITIDQNNRLYVADNGNNQIKQFTSSGTFISAFGSWGFQNGQFNTIKSIGIHLGSLWVLDYGSKMIIDDYGELVIKNIHRLQRFSADGQFLSKWKLEKLNMSTEFSSFTFIDDHTILLSSISDHCIHEYTMTIQDQTIDLHWFRSWGESDLQCPQDITNNGSYIFVVDSCQNTIETFSFNGQHLETIAYKGNQPGQLNTPEHIFVDSSGDVYISDQNHRIQIFQQILPLDKRRAIIVTSRWPVSENDSLWDNIRTVADAAYMTLKYKGYKDDEIIYLSNVRFDMNIDGDASLHALENSVLMNDASEIFIYLVGQGNEDSFVLNKDEIVTPYNLKEYCHFKKLTIIADFQGSGTFLNQISHDNCVTIASSSVNENMLQDNTFLFSKFFWNAIFYGYSLKQAFLLSDQSISAMSQNQKPSINANGNDISNEYDDLLMVESMHIGNTTIMAGSAEIGSLTATFYENNCLTTMVHLINDTQIEQVKLIIVPETTISSPIEMQLYSVQTGVYEGIKTLDAWGGYTLTAYAIHTSGLYSFPKTIYIHKSEGPDAFENDDIFENATILTINGEGQQHGFHKESDHDWVSFDAVKNQTYVIETFDPGMQSDTVIDLFDTDGITPVWEDTLDNNGIGNGEKRLFHCIQDGKFYIRIKHHHSSIYGLDTQYKVRVYVEQTQNNRHITGKLVDAINHQPIADQTVSLGMDLTTVSNSQGHFYFFNQAPETQCLTINITGYEPYTKWVDINPINYSITTNSIAPIDLGDIVLHPIIHQLTISTQGNGWVYPAEHVSVRFGDSQQFHINSDPCSALSGITIDNEPLAYTLIDHVFELPMIQKDSNLTFIFTPQDYTISTLVTGNGQLIPDQATSIPCGLSQQFSIIPDKGHYLEQLTIDDQAVELATSYEFFNIRASHTIASVFAACYYHFLTGTTWFDQDGGAGILVVESPQSCERIFPSSDNWITIRSVKSSGDTYTVNFTVEDMDQGTIRIGKLSLDDNQFTINQNLINTENIQVSIDLHEGWNLVSLPVSINIADHFPDAIVMYEFSNGSYQQAHQMNPGVGYWIKNSKNATYSLTVKKMPQLSMSLSEGWHLIGSTSSDTPVISTIPEDRISVIYMYENGRYERAYEIEMGRGFWIKLMSDCELSIE